MNKRHIALTLLSILPSYSALAGTMGSVENNLNRVISLSLGPSWSDAGKTQTIYLQPELTNTYVAKRKSENLMSGEVFFGIQRAFQPHLQAQLGIAVAGTTSSRLHGNIWQDADPDFNNYTYFYKVSHMHVAAKGKVLTDIVSFIQPYVSASIGVGFNHAYHFTSNPLLYEVGAQPPFQPHTTSAFTYTLGAGLQKSLNPNWSLGIGYEFADWGLNYLGRASDQTMGNGIRLSHLYTNQLQFNVTFLA